MYKGLWAEFWTQKIGYNPAERKMTGSKMTLQQARTEDEELEKEFVEFYMNKVSK